jgi:MFS transporter, DHA2 family, methylenomycin A resistance protein
VEALGWRSVFFVNVPLSLFVLYAGFVHTTESLRDPSRKLDLGGQITSAFALIAFAFTVIEGNALGWKSPAILAGAVLTVAFGLAFVMIERRAEQPMIRFSLLCEPLLSAGVWNMLAMNVGFFTLYLIASLFIQDVRRVDALTTGWFLLSNNLLFFLSNQFSGRIVRFLGEGGTVLAGMGLSVIGLASLALFHAHTAAAWTMVPLALCGLGWGVAFTPINDLAMSVVPERDDGLASGLLSLGRPLGAVFGTAVFGAVLGAFMTASLHRALEAVNAPDSALRSIEGAIHHGGIWAVMHHALKWGLPAHTLRTSVEAGFMTGMRVSGILAALLMLAAIAYAMLAYRAKRSA